jgi:hypothetical protein
MIESAAYIGSSRNTQETAMAQDKTPDYTADDQLDFCREWADACGGGEGVRAWLERERPHLLRAYDADFLVQAVERSRAAAQTVR